MPAPGLYIGSTSSFAGKNTLNLGIGLRMNKEGLKCGYMKPVGAIPVEVDGRVGDEDAFFIQQVLDLHEDPALVTPASVTHDFRIRAFNGQLDDPRELLRQIQDAYEKLSQDKDMMLVGGSGNMFSARYCGLDAITLIKALGLKAIIIDRLIHEVSYDGLLALKELLGDHLCGIVLNAVPASYIPEVENIIGPFLERNDIKVLGLLPNDPLLGSIRVETLAEGLGGRIVAGQKSGDRMVENFLIGTMQVENFMTYFRRYPNAAVIVGGDRADVQLVAIEGNCSCLVLTGNLYPNDIIFSRADALNVPIIMVRDDTYTVAKKMERLLGRHKLRDAIKVRQTAQVVSSNLDFQHIRAALGV